jgi:cobalt/nickel transport protein
MVIPSDQVVMQGEDADIKVDLMFWHPFENIGMNMAKPDRFGVLANSKNIDLLGYLRSAKKAGYQTWTTNYRLKRPGAYLFYMEPRPYWEPAEDLYIVHYTKTVVAAFGDDKGWDKEIGLKTEIVPLSKPYGLYTCPDFKTFSKQNVFRGLVKVDGKPRPDAHVEVQYFNEDRGNFGALTDFMVTNIKADDKGVFMYAVPKAGWWGFAALNMSDEKIKHQGKDKDVELGAVIWVRFHEMK